MSLAEELLADLEDDEEGDEMAEGGGGEEEEEHNEEGVEGDEEAMEVEGEGEVEANRPAKSECKRRSKRIRSLPFWPFLHQASSQI